ncbi:hypothetical protein ACHAP5_002925 [Fusarium lateritium]
MAIVAGNVLAFLVVAIFFLFASNQDVDEWLRGYKPSKGKMGSIKDFFRDIGRMFSQREPEERYVVRNGVFIGLDKT